jgi:hypothetical protein
MGAHVRDGCGLACRPGGGDCGGADGTSVDSTDETAADLLRDVNLAASKGACTGDRVTGAGVTRGLRLE